MPEPSLHPWNYSYTKYMYWKAGTQVAEDGTERIVFKFIKCIGCMPDRRFEIGERLVKTDLEFILWYTFVNPLLLR